MAIGPNPFSGSSIYGYGAETEYERDKYRYAQEQAMRQSQMLGMQNALGMQEMQKQLGQKPFPSPAVPNPVLLLTGEDE